jgi:O-antigen/teichoic acid export membrane protein
MWGAGAECSRIIIAVFALFAHAKMLTKILIYPNLLGAVLAVFLVWLFVINYGIAGVGPALALSSVCSLLLTIYITTQFTVLRISLKTILPPLLMGSTLVLISRVPFAFSSTDSSVTAMVCTLLGTTVIFILFQIYFLADALGIKEKVDNLLKRR